MDEKQESASDVQGTVKKPLVFSKGSYRGLENAKQRWGQDVEGLD